MSMDDMKLIAFIGAQLPEQARAFYEEILGLQLVAEEPSVLVFDSIGTVCGDLSFPI